ncbi:MAG: aminotransferase class I/II-fold pyridoxal phosphate-dependent enzyme [Candidatus Omnitrophica bacterium]|nr:aminotransferase class I/II-fold pyridoxal phosphate-dependent enzyme [Candidatus Omnitrophota bacterium]
MRKIELSKRLKSFPPYLFAEIDRQKEILKKKKIDFVDVSIGDPDVPAPQAVIEALYRAAKLKDNQKYALDQGKALFRKSIQRWFKKRFSVSLDENKHILPLIGSKEGLIHFPLAFVNSSDYIIVPSPAYPGYKSAARFVSARIYELPLLEKNSFLPELSKIPQRVKNKAKLIYLNYPNNPTTAVAPLSFLKEAVSFCSKYGIILAYDNAYSEIYFSQKPHSILEVKGAEEIAIEFHSLSKTFCMTGFRVGWACGNSDLIRALLKVKSNIDSGLFGAIQEAAALALDRQEKYVVGLRKIIKERRDLFVAGLKNIGFKNIHSDSTFYVWMRIPKGFKSSIDYSKYLISEKNIVATPGLGFGKYAEGFIRFALTVDKKKLAEVLKKLNG